MPLDDLEEQRRPILHRLGEDLQHVALVVAVDQDAQLGQLAHVLLDRADALGQHLVIGLRHAQERDVVVPHRPHRLDDVAGGQGDVLHAGAAVELQVLLDLRAAAALGRLVDRELDPPVPSCTTFDIRAEYSVLMSLSSKWTSCVKPSTFW